MRKLKIFISSTIYDFKDLRSSLKYVLEEFGYTVFLSEYNDFPIINDTDSYNNCLKVIEQCDYFILLIGSRTGGYFDQQNKITITRKEYKYAYDLFLKGKLRIISLVRQNIWNLKSDRKDLLEYLNKQYLKENELDETQIEDIKNHKSKILNDADVILDFLDEVTKKDEMKKAVKGEKSFPKGNWLHTFNNFNEIINSLTSELQIKSSVEQKIFIENLKKEINGILKECYQKNDGKLSKITFWGDLARISITDNLNGSSKIKSRYLKWLAMFIVVYKSNLKCKFIEKAIDQNFFMEFDIVSNTFIKTNINKALERLYEEISSLKLYNSPEIKKENLNFMTEFKDVDSKSDSYTIIDNFKLLMPLVIYDTINNIILLCESIICKLEFDLDEFSTLKLSPKNPFSSEMEKLELEYIDDSEILEMLKKTYLTK